LLAKEEAMSWLNNANTIVNFISAIIGIGGFIYGVASYLIRRAHTTRQDLGSEAASTTQKSSIPYRPLSLVEWISVFGQGVVDTADFVISLFSFAYQLEDESVMTRISVCGFICIGAALLGELILRIAFDFVLLNLGLSNAPGASIAISAIIIFLVFSFMYIYHVGLRVEMKQLERYQEIRKQS
jgi:hypothetical protein